MGHDSLGRAAELGVGQGGGDLRVAPGAAPRSRARRPRGPARRASGADSSASSGHATAACHRAATRGAATGTPDPRPRAIGRITAPRGCHGQGQDCLQCAWRGSHHGRALV